MSSKDSRRSLGGFNGPEWDVPAEDPYQTIDVNTGKLVTRGGRPARDGAEIAEECIERGLVERARIFDAVLAKGKQLVKKAEAKAKGAKG